MINEISLYTGYVVWLLAIVWLAWIVLYPLLAISSFLLMNITDVFRQRHSSKVKWYLLPRDLVRGWWDFLTSGIPDSLTLASGSKWSGVFKWELSISKEH